MTTFVNGIQRKERQVIALCWTTETPLVSRQGTRALDETLLQRQLQNGAGCALGIASGVMLQKESLLLFHYLFLAPSF